jgi:hypothetical protein
MRYRSLAVLGLTGVLIAPTAIIARGATDSGQPNQTFFRKTLIDDANTSSAIVGMLKSNAAIVDPATIYPDVTGDGKADAIVRVHSAGAAGVIAVYVFSTDGSTAKDLRAVFRSQQLYRAITDVTSGKDVVIDTPKYKAGDDLCCPSQMTHRVYAWSEKSHKFNRTTLTTVKA